MTVQLSREGIITKNETKSGRKDISLKRIWELIKVTCQQEIKISNILVITDTVNKIVSLKELKDFL